MHAVRPERPRARPAGELLAEPTALVALDARPVERVADSLELRPAALAGEVHLALIGDPLVARAVRRGPVVDDDRGARLDEAAPLPRRRPAHVADADEIPHPPAG